MPRGFLDYLKRGSLFRSEHIESSYRSFSEGDLRRELDLYRGYCLQYTNKRTSSKTDLTIFAESLNTFMPEEKLLKQCALYVDKVIINDPVFVHTIPRSELTEAMNLFLEMPASGIDRRRLSRSAAYVNRLRPAIQSGFAEILPISYLHEPPEEIPVMYSANLHADVLPVNMMEWFRAAAKVYPIRKAKEGWYVLHDQPLEPCRAISVNFKGHPSHTDALYFLAQFQPTSFDENTGEVEFIQQMPTTPPDLDTFNAWVFQSINQTAKHFFDRVIEELSVASSFNATYLTRSPFVADLLSKAWYQVPDFETDIINRVLRLELPVLEAIPLERVINLSLYFAPSQSNRKQS